MTGQERTGLHPARARPEEGRAARVASLLGAGLVLVLVLVWMVNLEGRLSEIRAPRDFSSSEVLTGHGVMAPGYHDVDEVDADESGDWVAQEIGDSSWLATDTPGSQIQVAFYGTDVYLVARIGPEAGRAYVRVDGEPVSGLNEDERGTYSDLWAGEASDQPILVASGLSHGEHVVEVTAGSEGEVAISAFEVVAETPFQWAFLLAYAGIAGGLFLIVRTLLVAMGRRDRPSDGEAGTTRSESDAVA